MQVTSGRSLEANTTRIASSGKRVNVVYFFNFERRNDVIDLTQAEWRDGINAANAHSVAVGGCSAQAGARQELLTQSAAVFKSLGGSGIVHGTFLNSRRLMHAWNSWNLSRTKSKPWHQLNERPQKTGNTGAQIAADSSAINFDIKKPVGQSCGRGFISGCRSQRICMDARWMPIPWHWHGCRFQKNNFQKIVCDDEKNGFQRKWCYNCSTILGVRGCQLVSCWQVDCWTMLVPWWPPKSERVRDLKLTPICGVTSVNNSPHLRT